MQRLAERSLAALASDKYLENWRQGLRTLKCIQIQVQISDNNLTAKGQDRSEWTRSFRFVW
jgi:hypothetical protein